MVKPIFFDFCSKLLSSTFLASSTIPFLNKKVNSLDFFQDKEISFPIIFRHQSGTKLLDLINTGNVGIYVISDRMIQALSENNLTGWKSYPVQILDKKGNEIKGYQGFSIIGRAGPIDYSKSQIIEKKLVPHGPLCRYYKGMFIDPDTWDGSDFFMTYKNLGVFVTERAANVIKDNKFTNIDLTNIADIEVSDDIVMLHEKKFRKE